MVEEEEQELGRGKWGHAGICASGVPLEEEKQELGRGKRGHAGICASGVPQG